MLQCRKSLNFCTAACIFLAVAEHITGPKGPTHWRKPMSKTQDYTKMMQEMMGSFPVDMSAVQEAF